MLRDESLGQGPRLRLATELHQGLDLERDRRAGHGLLQQQPAQFVPGTHGRAVDGGDGVSGRNAGTRGDGGGGRRAEGEGFGIAIVLRYILETCAKAKDALKVLKRVPVHLPYNLAILDRGGGDDDGEHHQGVVDDDGDVHGRAVHLRRCPAHALLG